MISVGVWVVAGTTDGPYPCRCREDPSRRSCGPDRRRGGAWSWCPCWGRLDGLAAMPPDCCALRYVVPIDMRSANAQDVNPWARQS